MRRAVGSITPIWLSIAYSIGWGERIRKRNQSKMVAKLKYKNVNRHNANLIPICSHLPQLQFALVPTFKLPIAFEVGRRKEEATLIANVKIWEVENLVALSL